MMPPAKRIPRFWAWVLETRRVTALRSYSMRVGMENNAHTDPTGVQKATCRMVPYRTDPNYLRKWLIPGTKCCLPQRKNAKKRINFRFPALCKNGFRKIKSQKK